MVSSTETVRRRLYAQLDPRCSAAGSLSPLNKLIVVLILLATLFAILDTEPELSGPYRTLFDTIELLFGLFFIAEYLARLWTAPEAQPGASPWRCRWRFAVSPAALIDLAVLVSTLLPFLSGNAAVLRLVRLARIATLAKLGRMSSAMAHLGRALRICRGELVFVVALAAGVMLTAATALYWIEGEIQPDKFGSVPRAMWWAVVTMTTIGYGDAFPVTAAGKVAASLLAVVGVGLIALPAGIMAGALSQVMRSAEGPKSDL